MGRQLPKLECERPSLYSLRHCSIMTFVSLRERNHSMGRHSSWNFPLRRCPAYKLLIKFSPKDTDTRKVHHADEVSGVVAIAGTDTTKSLEPGKCSFHYPATRRMSLFPRDCFLMTAVQVFLKSIPYIFTKPACSRILYPDKNTALHRPKNVRPLRSSFPVSARSGGLSCSFAPTTIRLGGILRPSTRRWSLLPHLPLYVRRHSQSFSR